MTSSVREGRPLLVGVEVSGPAAQVTLEIRGRRYTGRASIAPTGQPAGLVSAAARATLEALEEATPAAVHLRLEYARILPLEDTLPALAVVLTSVTVADVPLRAPGAVLLRDKPAWAGARAVLQGLNRRLEILGL